jgi:ABC-type multidrug transport system permease subunit
VFLREQANKMYTVGAYYLAKIAIETPVMLITPMLYSLIVYFGVGTTITASQFFLFYCTLALVVQTAASFGYFLSSLFQKAETAQQLSGVIMMPIMLFGGQFANSKNIQAWISWFQYISPIRYGLEALATNEFDSRVYNTTGIIRNILTNSTQTF